MKKLTFALFVALGATLLVSCGPKSDTAKPNIDNPVNAAKPKIDTPENLGKSLLEAMSSQDKEAYTELFATKEDITKYLDQADKSQMPDSIKNKFEEGKTEEISRLSERVTNKISPDYDKTNEYAQKASVNWEKAEFVSFESREDNHFNLKSTSGRVYFKTDTGSNFYLKFQAIQIGDDWKIVEMDGFRVKKD